MGRAVMVDLLSDTDRAALRDVALALRGAQAGAEALAAVKTAEAHARAALDRQEHRDRMMGAGSRVLVAVAVVVGLAIGLPSLKSTPVQAPTLTNVATSSQVECVRSDLAVLLEGAQPDPLCGYPPGVPTTLPKRP
jgi:hypothetical protein